MKKSTNHIDNFLYENIDGLGELPPAHIWGAVENALDDHELVVKNKRAKNNRYALLLLFVLVGASAGLFWLLTDEDETPPQQALSIIQKNSRTVDASTGNPVAQKNISRITITDQPHAELEEQAFVSGYEPNHQLETADAIGHTTFIEQATVSTDRNLPTVNDVPQILTASNTLKPGIGGMTDQSISRFNTVHKPRKHKLSVTAFFAPDITTRNLEQSVGSSKDEGKDEMVKTEKNGALDFTFGARIDYRLNNHFSLQSGVSFSTNTIDIAEKTVYARYDKAGILRYRFNMSSGYCFSKLKNIPAPQFAGDSARTEGSHSTLHYINIPLIVKYNFPVSRRIDLTVQAGIVARFIAWESISTTYDYFGFKERSISRQIEGLKKSYFNGVVGVGAEYAVNKKLALTIFPSFNFATSSINKDAPVKAYPNTLSVATGIKFNF